jgi:hypothetical protein
VSWRVKADDGDTEKGTFTFTVRSSAVSRAGAARSRRRRRHRGVRRRPEANDRI